MLFCFVVCDNGLKGFQVPISNFEKVFGRFEIRGQR